MTGNRHRKNPHVYGDAIAKIGRDAVGNLAWHQRSAKACGGDAFSDGIARREEEGYKWRESMNSSREIAVESVGISAPFQSRLGSANKRK